MKSLILILTCMYSLNSQAVFQKVWKGYQISSFNQSQHLDVKINEANFKFQSNQFDWKLEIAPEHDHTFLDGLFTFQVNDTIKNSLSYGLKKSSYKWGTFSIKQSQVQYDLSQWNSPPADNLYEVQNLISYSYDFLDRSGDKDYELIELENKKGKAQAKLSVDQGYFDFFTIYLQAKLQLFSVELTKEFVKRSEKRVNQVRKRVQDGLSRKVELHQAQSSLLNQREALENSRSSFKQNLAILENIIGNKIPEQSFKQVTWKRYSYDHWKDYIKTQEHYSLEVLKKSLKVSEKALEKISNQNGYKLLFGASYLTNDIDESSSESMSNSLSGERFSQNISLNLVIPLGGDKNKGLREKYAYQKKKNELDLLTKKDELKAKKEALVEQIKYLEKATSFSKDKVKLARTILKEQNRLYLRGQANFNDVITAEESYINAQLSQKRLLAQYETLVGNYAFFNNSIKSFLDVYQD